MRPGPPLFLQALGLVAATLIVAQAATALVIVALPAPTPDIHGVADVAVAALRGHAAPTAEGLSLTASLAGRPPARLTEGRRRLEFRDALARDLGLRPGDVVVAQPGLRILAFRGPGPAAARGETPRLFGGFVVGVRRPDGRWTVVRPAGGLVADPWRRRVLLALAIAAAAVAPLAWLFARRLAHPMAAFAAAAERLGREPRPEPLSLQGSPEVVRAAAAFNEMAERLARYVADRTAMVAAIAHDLRTPLTRLRFRLEAAPEDLRRSLSADIEEMDQMVASALAFVRDAGAPRPYGKVDLASVVETVIDEAALTGAAAQVESARAVIVDGDALALKRLVANLVGNALSFGQRARARVFAREGMALVEIEDDGPGMAEGEMERAFAPFQRLEGSRSRDTGGAGLGLAVARAIARAHGGEVALANRAPHGLTARIALPLAAG